MEFLENFLVFLIERSISNASTDSLAFAFYYAIKYNKTIERIDGCIKKIIKLNDCISTLLAYKYFQKMGHPIGSFEEKSKELLELPEREQDKFWLFLYEILEANELPDDFLKKIKKKNISFLKDL